LEENTFAGADGLTAIRDGGHASGAAERVGVRRILLARNCKQEETVGEGKGEVVVVVVEILEGGREEEEEEEEEEALVNTASSQLVLVLEQYSQFWLGLVLVLVQHSCCQCCATWCKYRY
jgi:hypothetical protein